MTRGRIVLMVIASGALWVFAGRWLALIADSIWTRRVETRALSSISVGPWSIQIGERVLEIAGEVVPTLADGKLVLVREGGRFVLGPVQPGGVNDYQVTPEKGDEVSLEVSDGMMRWPTPFEFNFLTGRSPSWKTYRYFRLSWKKRGGETLRATWRYERWFYPTDGWSSGLMTSPGSTGVVGMKF